MFGIIVVFYLFEFVSFKLLVIIFPNSILLILTTYTQLSKVY